MRRRREGAVSRALALDRQCQLLGLPRPVPEYQFARHLSGEQLRAIGQTKPRKWAIDWAFVDERLAVEVEGGYAMAGRHTRVAGFLGDLEKYACLACLGWRLLRVTPRQVRSGEAVQWIQRALTQGDGHVSVAAHSGTVQEGHAQAARGR